jgi:hypothetical protein
MEDSSIRFFKTLMMMIGVSWPGAGVYGGIEYIQHVDHVLVSHEHIQYHSHQVHMHIRHDTYYSIVYMSYCYKHPVNLYWQRGTGPRENTRMYVHPGHRAHIAYNSVLAPQSSHTIPYLTGGDRADRYHA